jgi:hypothetical protein
VGVLLILSPQLCIWYTGARAASGGGLWSRVAPTLARFLSQLDCRKAAQHCHLVNQESTACLSVAIPCRKLHDDVPFYPGPLGGVYVSEASPSSPLLMHVHRIIFILFDSLSALFSNTSGLGLPCVCLYTRRMKCF